MKAFPGPGWDHTLLARFRLEWNPMTKKQPPKPSPDKWLPLPKPGVKTEVKEKEVPPLPSSKEKYFHRDLSWLHFNDRVLSEAADDTVPALERLRFAGIVSSN